MGSRRTGLIAGATMVSCVGVLVSAAASFERGGTVADRLLIGAVSVAITLACHMLPSISRSVLARALWVVCLLITAWGHAAYFTGASGRAGAGRAAHVEATAADAALRDELAAIQARPVSAAAADLAVARGKALSAGAVRCRPGSPSECRRIAAAAGAASARVDALTEELAQAQRAADLRSRVTEVAGRQDAARAAASVDPVAGVLSVWLGVSADSIVTAVSVLSAVAVELLAALLWSAAIRRDGAESTQDRAKPQKTAPLKAQAPTSGALGQLLLAARRMGRPSARDSPGLAA